MLDDTRLLVVDDEDTICRGCRRILSPAGFRVDTSCDAREGLSLAVEKNYAAVLLDIRMPEMDGIQFLAELRKKKPDLPVIIITAYPSVSDAASTMRLGADDYVTKPFTPARLTHAIGRLLTSPRANANKEPACEPPSARPWMSATEGFLHFDEAWCQRIEDRVVRVGAMVARSGGGTVEAVWPPKVGWTVYQGLPLAGVTLTGRRHLTVPAPVSGTVVASNAWLLDRPSMLWDNPYGEGWIACVRPTRFENEVQNCKPRSLILANAHEASAREQSSRLESLGCCVSIARTLGEVGPALQQEPDCPVLIMDAASLGEHGPELARRISDAAPSTRIVVAASRTREWESAYRRQPIFDYVVEPFVGDGVVNVLDAAFRSQVPPVRCEQPPKTPPAPVSRMCIIHRDGQKVGLVAEGGLLQRHVGLGRQLAQRLADQQYAVKVTLGRTFISSAIQEAASSCDHVLILLARDTGRLPGTLVREEFTPACGQKVAKATNLLVQPSSPGGHPLEFDSRTTAALAEHIAHEMTLC